MSERKNISPNLRGTLLTLVMVWLLGLTLSVTAQKLVRYDSDLNTFSGNTTNAEQITEVYV